MNTKSNEAGQPEPQPNSEQTADSISVSPAIGNTNVSGSAFQNGKKRLPKGKYKYVCGYELKGGTIVYHCDIRQLKWSAYFESEHKAAKKVDLKLIEKGLEPVNVLKRK